MNALYITNFLPIEEADRIGRIQNPAGYRKKLQLLSLFESIDVLNVTTSVKSNKYFTGSSNLEYFTSKVYSPACLNIPIINLFVNPILVFCYTRRLPSITRYDTLILYNYTWETVVTSCILRMFTSKPTIIVQFEDDFVSYFGGLRKKLFQLSFFIGSIVTDKVIINNRNMLELLPENVDYYIFRGVVVDNSDATRRFNYEGSTKLKVLFGGNFDNIRGIDLVVELLDGLENFDRFEFLITGDGDIQKKRELVESVDAFKKRGGSANYFGLTPRYEYEKILSEINVGLALQAPDNRFSRYCFPSKVFELYERNIPVITTAISDLETGFLPNLIFIDYTVESLLRALNDLYFNYSVHLHTYQYQKRDLAEQFGFNKIKLEINDFVEK